MHLSLAAIEVECDEVLSIRVDDGLSHSVLRVDAPVGRKGREEGREEGREGGRKGGRKGGREEGREGRKGGRREGREWRETGRRRCIYYYNYRYMHLWCAVTKCTCFT